MRNVGDLPLTISGVSTTNQSVFGFGDLSMLPATLVPGGEVGIEANFLASAVAGMPAAAELQVHTDDPLRPLAALGVTGRAAGPHLTLQPPEVLDLGAGTAPTGVLTITSDGTDPVALRRVDVTDPSFAVSGLPALPASLAPGTSLGLTVTCNPAAPGLHMTWLTLMNDGSPNGQAQVNVQAQT